MRAYPCRHSTCLALLPARGYCPKHEPIGEREESERQRQYDQQDRDRDAKRFYASAAWRTTRAARLATSPVCEQCQRAWATDVHHVVPVRESVELRLEPTNLIALCGMCHKRIEARKKRGK